MWHAVQKTRISGNIWPLASQGPEAPVPSGEHWCFTSAAWHCEKMNSQIWLMRGMLVICWLHEKGISGGQKCSHPFGYVNDWVGAAKTWRDSLHQVTSECASDCIRLFSDTYHMLSGLVPNVAKSALMRMTVWGVKKGKIKNFVCSLIACK